jgi:putative MATE family efflux protein
MIAEKRKVDFTEGKLFLKILCFALPLVLSNLLQTLYNSADMMIVSLSSEKNAVGAVGVTAPFCNLLVHIFTGISVGVNVVVAKYIGAKNAEKIEKAVHTSLIMAVLFGVLGGGVGIALSSVVLVWMGVEGSLFQLALLYVRIYFIGIPFLSLTNYLSAIFRAKGDGKTPLIVLAGSGLFNVLLNLLFVLAFHMSVDGVAWATTLSNVLSFLVLLFLLGKSKDETAFSFKKLGVDRKSFLEIVRIGLPAGLSGALFSISNIMIQSSIVTVNNALTPVGSAFEPIVNGSAAAGNIETFIYTAMNAVAHAVITVTSQNVGAKKPERVKSVLYNGYLVVLLFYVIMCGGVFCFLKPLLALYDVKNGVEGSLNALAYSAALTRVYIICIPYFLCGLMDVSIGTLRGFGKSLLSTVLSLIGSLLFRVIWLATVFQAFPSLQTIFICYPITWMMVWIAGHVCVFIVMKEAVRKKKMEEV